MVKSYSATYVKKSGEKRKMNFIRLNDLPESFLSDRVKGDSKPRNLGEGREVVFDVENDGFRVFNWNTVIGEAETSQVDLRGAATDGKS